MSSEPVRPLTTIGEGRTVRVVALVGGRGFQNRIRSMGVNVGGEVKVLSNHSRMGPMLVMSKGARLALGHGTAQKILVSTDFD